MGYQIKSRIWIDYNGHILLGEGRVQLLKEIQASGSLTQAAKALKMSYKKAWDLIDSMNKTAAQPVVITSTGGANGGGTQVTPYGIKLIESFDQINANCWAFLDQQIKTITDASN